MATATATVRIKKNVIVCERCKRPKSEDARPLKIDYDGELKTPPDYVVCKGCATVILNGLMKAKRATKAAKNAKNAAPEAAEPVLI